MADLDVRIERLSPMRVAWVRAIGTNPEQQVWSILRAWAEPRGLLSAPEQDLVLDLYLPIDG